MFAWIMTNWGTLAVLAVLLVIVAAIVYTLHRDRRTGKNGCGVRCGGDCAGCSARRDHRE